MQPPGLGFSVFYSFLWCDASTANFRAAAGIKATFRHQLPTIWFQVNILPHCLFQCHFDRAHLALDASNYMCDCSFRWFCIARGKTERTPHAIAKIERHVVLGLLEGATGHRQRPISVMQAFWQAGLEIHNKMLVPCVRAICRLCMFEFGQVEGAKVASKPLMSHPKGLSTHQPSHQPHLSCCKCCVMGGANDVRHSASDDEIASSGVHGLHTCAIGGQPQPSACRS